jgi:hypothetical protein
MTGLSFGSSSLDIDFMTRIPFHFAGLRRGPF